jgi:hypothetical protein
VTGWYPYDRFVPGDGDDSDARADTDCACTAAGFDECPCEADGPDGLCACCRDGDHRGSCADPAGRAAVAEDLP